MSSQLDDSVQNCPNALQEALASVRTDVPMLCTLNICIRLVIDHGNAYP